MTSGRKWGAARLRLISVVDDLYPLPSGSKVSASSSKASLPSVIDPVAKDVETKSKDERSQRVLKREDSVVSSAPSVVQRSKAPPKQGCRPASEQRHTRFSFLHRSNQAQSRARDQKWQQRACCAFAPCRHGT